MYHVREKGERRSPEGRHCFSLLAQSTVMLPHYTSYPPFFQISDYPQAIRETHIFIKIIQNVDPRTESHPRYLFLL